MPLTHPRLTCVSVSLARPDSGRKKENSRYIHYDIEPRIPTFFHIIPAKLHDTRAMDVISYKENSFYIFDRTSLVSTKNR